MIYYRGCFMKKVCFITLSVLILLYLLVSCKDSNGSDNITLKKFFGTQYDEMQDICDDESQIEVANQIIETAKEAFYSISKDNVSGNIEQFGALSKYIANLPEDIDEVDLNISLVTTKQNGDLGYIWVRYSVSYKKEDKIISGSDNVLSRWEIKKNADNIWQVTSIKEMP